MDASRKFEPTRETETRGRKAPLAESRGSEPAEADEFSLDLSDLGPSHAVEPKRETKFLENALPLSFSDDDLGTSPPPERPVVTRAEFAAPEHDDENNRLLGAKPDEKLETPAREHPEALSLGAKAPPSEPKTRFSTSIGTARPKLESDDDEVPPEDLPPENTRTKTAALLRAKLHERWTNLATIAVAKAREHAKSFDELRRTPVRPSATRKKSLPSRSPRLDARFAGPIACVVGVLVVYGGVTHLLGTAPWSEASPQVPDLGASFGNDPKATAVVADAPQRNFRIQGEGKPGETTPRAATQNEAAPSGGAPVFEIEGFPEGTSFPGKSLLEVVTSEEELIYVDGVFIGRGPLRRMPLSEGQHAVAIRSGGAERSGQFDAPAGKMVRASFVSLPAAVGTE